MHVHDAGCLWTAITLWLPLLCPCSHVGYFNHVFGGLQTHCELLTGVKVSDNYDVGLAPYILVQFGIEISSSKPAMPVTNIFGEKNPSYST